MRFHFHVVILPRYATNERTGISTDASVDADVEKSDFTGFDGDLSGKLGRRPVQPVKEEQR
ncbi:MAG: hypothetical protein C0401_08280 [Anaerolinea sp.]|nr:hypothetical protein [Anaerolinea sp.]